MGVFTVPSDFTAGISLTVAYSGTTNTGSGSSAGYLFATDTSGNRYFTCPIFTSGYFNLSSTFTSFPSTFVAGVSAPVYEQILYPAWFLSGVVMKVTLVYY